MRDKRMKTRKEKQEKFEQTETSFPWEEVEAINPMV